MTEKTQEAAKRLLQQIESCHHPREEIDLEDVHTLAKTILAQPASQRARLTDERIDRIAEFVVRGMPEGIRGFCRVWGWQQFAHELMDVCAAPSAQAAESALDLLTEMDRYFTSGNSIPIEKAGIPAAEWQELRAAVVALARSAS